MKQKQETRLRDRSFFKLIRWMATERPMGIIGLVILVVLLFTALFANQLAPYGINQVDLMNMLKGSSAAHPMGTDNLGRDVFSNVIYGARVSVIIGFAATAVMLAIAVLIGTSSAVLGGAFDMVVQRFVDAWQCIPNMLVLMMAMSIVGRGTVQLIFAIGIPMGISTSRVVRSAVISLRSNLYLEAADILGASTWRIVYRHIIPNIAPILIISAATQIGQVILMESSMSFLGMGVPPGVPSWGSMLSQEGRAYMELVPSLALWPGLALTLTVFGANMFGDALRDLLDPRLKGGAGSFAGKRKKKREQKEEESSYAEA